MSTMNSLPQPPVGPMRKSMLSSCRLTVPVFSKVTGTCNEPPWPKAPTSCEDGVTITYDRGSISGAVSVESLETKSLDLGAVIGAVVSFAAGESASIFLRGGYDLGLRNILDDEDDSTSAKNRALFFGAGVVFPVGG